MTGLTPITPAERLLETLRYIREMALAREFNFVWGAANDAIQEYEHATRQPEVVKGDRFMVVKSKGDAR